MCDREVQTKDDSSPGEMMMGLSVNQSVKLLKNRALPRPVSRDWSCENDSICEGSCVCNGITDSKGGLTRAQEVGGPPVPFAVIFPRINVSSLSIQFQSETGSKLESFGITCARCVCQCCSRANNLALSK